MNLRLMKNIVGILLELQRAGVQIFLSTHDYIILKEFDLQTQNTDQLLFHSLYRNKESGNIEILSTANFLEISPNTINDTFGEIVNCEIKRSMEK